MLAILHSRRSWASLQAGLFLIPTVILAAPQKFPKTPFPTISGSQYVNNAFMQHSEGESATLLLHRGIDISLGSGAAGSSVRAPLADGQYCTVHILPAPNDEVVLISQRREASNWGGKWSYVSILHIDRSESLYIGQSVSNGTELGTLQTGPTAQAPHIEFYSSFEKGSAGSVPADRKIVNPLLRGFQDASFASDLVGPGFSGLTMTDDGSDKLLSIDVADPSGEMILGNFVLNGMYRVELVQNETIIDFIQFDEFVSKPGGTFPPAVAEYYATGAVVPNSVPVTTGTPGFPTLNNPNSMRYFLRWTDGFFARPSDLIYVRGYDLRNPKCEGRITVSKDGAAIFACDYSISTRDVIRDFAYTLEPGALRLHWEFRALPGGTTADVLMNSGDGIRPLNERPLSLQLGASGEMSLTFDHRRLVSVSDTISYFVDLISGHGQSRVRLGPFVVRADSSHSTPRFEVFPVPSRDTVQFRVGASVAPRRLSIYTAEGRIVDNVVLAGDQSALSWRFSERLETGGGVFFAVLRGDDGLHAVRKVVLLR